MAKKERIDSPDCVPASGTYSQAIRAGEFVFLMGMTGRHPETHQYESGVDAQTRRTLSNIDAVLAAAGCSREDIVRTTLIMGSIKDFKLIDDIYAAWLPPREEVPLPARTAFEAGGLPHGALLMIEVTALVPGS